MRGRVRTIQTDRHPCNSALLELVDGLTSKKRRCAGANVGAQPQRNTAAEEGEKIRPLQRIAPGENHEGRPELAYLFEQAIPFTSSELRAIPVGDRTGAAMGASQIAGLSG